MAIIGLPHTLLFAEQKQHERLIPVFLPPVDP